MHRAAWILYQQREAGEDPCGLVVGPNHTFYSCVEGVLPALGESSATQMTVDDLALLDLPASQRRRFGALARGAHHGREAQGSPRVADPCCGCRVGWGETTPT